MNSKKNKYNAKQGFIMSLSYLKGEAMSAFCEVLPPDIYKQLNPNEGAWVFVEPSDEGGVYHLRLTQKVVAPRYVWPYHGPTYLIKNTITLEYIFNVNGADSTVSMYYHQIWLPH